MSGFSGSRGPTGAQGPAGPTGPAFGANQISIEIDSSGVLLDGITILPGRYYMNGSGTLTKMSFDFEGNAANVGGQTVDVILLYDGGLAFSVSGVGTAAGHIHSTVTGSHSYTADHYYGVGLNVHGNLTGALTNIVVTAG